MFVYVIIFLLILFIIYKLNIKETFLTPEQKNDKTKHIIENITGNESLADIKSSIAPYQADAVLHHDIKKLNHQNHFDFSHVRNIV